MDWVKLILEFIVQIIHYAAWPVIILVLFYMFREYVAYLLKSPITLRHGDTSVELNMLNELQQNLAKMRAEPTMKATDYSHKKLYLNQLVISNFYAGAIALGETDLIKAFQEAAKISFEVALMELEGEKVWPEQLEIFKNWAIIMKSSQGGKKKR